MDSETTFKLINELIVALSHWLWPIVTLIGLLIYKKPITGLLGKIKKGEFFGQKVDFEVDDLQKSVQQAEEEIAQIQSSADSSAENTAPELSPSQLMENIKKTDTDINQILDDSKNNVELAVIRLSNLLEIESKRILVSIGILPPDKNVAGLRTVFELKKHKLVSEKIIDSLLKFRDLRFQIVHGETPVDEKEVLRFLDIGISLLKAIRAIPHQIHIVSDVVEVYSDPECKNKRLDVEGVIIDTKSSDGTQRKSVVYTSKIGYYEVGKQVLWDWDFVNVFEGGWYFNKTDNKPERITHSLDFIGRHLDKTSSTHS